MKSYYDDHEMAKRAVFDCVVRLLLLRAGQCVLYIIMNLARVKLEHVCTQNVKNRFTMYGFRRKIVILIQRYHNRICTLSWSIKLRQFSDER